MTLALAGTGCGGGKTGGGQPTAGPVQPTSSGSASTVVHPAVTTIPAGDNPHDVVVASAHIWVADFGGPLIEFDTQGHRLRTIRVDAQAIAAGAGEVWVSELSNSNTGPQGRLTEVDARTGQVSRRLNTRDSVDVLAVGDGAVWAASRFAARITRVPVSGGAQRTLRLSGTPTAIAVGSSATWVAVGQAGTAQAVGEPQTGNGAVLKLDSSTGAQLAQQGETTVPTALAVAHGKVWVALAGDVDAVDGLDETTGRSVSGSPSINVGKQPTDLASGDGSVWALNYSDGTVTRVDPVTARATGTIAFASPTDPDRLAANSPIRLAVSAGTIWVTDAEANTLRRVSSR